MSEAFTKGQKVIFTNIYGVALQHFSGREAIVRNTGILTHMGEVVHIEFIGQPEIGATAYPSELSAAPEPDAAEDLTDVLCWSCQKDAVRLNPDREGRCADCPDDYSMATNALHPSDMSEEGMQ